MAKYPDFHSAAIPALAAAQRVHGWCSPDAIWHGACDIAPMASVDGVYVGPVALDEVPKLVEQIREGLPPLPGKQLRLRKSTDPGATRATTGTADPGVARATAGAADPVSPTRSHGTPMGGGPVGPPAAIEHPPPLPEEEDEE